MHQICYLFLIWNITNTVVCEGIKICLTPSKWMTVKPWSRKTRSFDVSFGSLHRILLFYTMSDAFDIKKLVPCSELGPQRRFHMIQHKCLPLHFTFRSFKRVIRLLMDYCNTLLTFVFFFLISVGLEARKVYDVIIHHVENAQQRMAWVAAMGYTEWLGMRTWPMRGFTMILNWIIEEMKCGLNLTSLWLDPVSYCCENRIPILKLCVPFNKYCGSRKTVPPQMGSCQFRKQFKPGRLYVHHPST